MYSILCILYIVVLQNLNIIILIKVTKDFETLTVISVEHYVRLTQSD